jgi:hypothetical protein
MNGALVRCKNCELQLVYVCVRQLQTIPPTRSLAAAGRLGLVVARTAASLAPARLALPVRVTASLTAYEAEVAP